MSPKCLIKLFTVLAYATTHEMTPDELKTILEGLPSGQSFNAKCIAKLKDAVDPLDVIHGLVGPHGDRIVRFVHGAWDAWGIDVKTCSKFCSRTAFPLVFNLSSFGDGITNYFLPFLALTAQLPYETGSFWDDFMSFCIALGCPMLVTFSLASTTFNAHLTKTKFDEILSHPAIDNGRDKRNILQKIAKHARYVLRHSQQVPLRANPTSSGGDIVPNPADEAVLKFWSSLHTRLKDSRRGYTASVIAQTLLAIVAWGLTLAAAYHEDLGVPTASLLLSTGTLWLWLIPNILGWIVVGVQSKKDTIKLALKEEARILKSQASGSDHDRSKDSPPLWTESNLKLSPILWRSLQGDEQVQGPAYNYARILTYPLTVEHVIEGLRLHLEDTNLGRLKMVSEAPHDSAAPSSRSSQNGTTEEGKRDPELQALHGSPIKHDYTTWNELPPTWKLNIVLATCLAVFVQWGIVGAATVIAWFTEVKGLGCRSGSYLLYGILATLAHIFLFSSVFLTNKAVLMCRDETKHKRRRSVVSILGVLLRFAGKGCAIVNACWIALGSIFEIIGFYNSCWCASNTLSLGSNGWIVLFAKNSILREHAEPSWAGGIALSFFSALIPFCIIWIYSRE